MTSPKLTDVAIARELGSERGPFTVRIGIPALFDEENGDFACPFEIQGHEETYSLFGGGIDSVQALLLASSMVGDYLEATGLNFTHSGVDGHGFPTTTVGDDVLTVSVVYKTTY